MKRNLFIPVLIILVGSFIFAEGQVISPETYASYYGDAFQGRQTASGEIFDMNAYTAAHRTLPFGTLLEITNLDNGRKVVVRVNDRGPFVANREIDVSKAAAIALDMLSKGVTRVSLKKIDPSNRVALGVPQERTILVEKTETEPTVTYQPQNVEKTEAIVTPQPEKKVVVETQVALPAKEEVVTPSIQVQPQVKDEKIYETVPMEEKVVVVPKSKKEKRELVYTPVLSKNAEGPLWRIQLGAFTREENALRLVIQLRKLNFEPAYEKTKTHTRVVLYGISPTDLEKVKTVLFENNYTDFILRQESW